MLQYTLVDKSFYIDVIIFIKYWDWWINSCIFRFLGKPQVIFHNAFSNLNFKLCMSSFFSIAYLTFIVSVTSDINYLCRNMTWHFRSYIFLYMISDDKYSFIYLSFICRSSLEMYLYLFKNYAQLN